MEKTKERRIRRLKKKRIWPSIVGLLLIVFFILVALLCEFSFLLLNIMERELRDGYELSLKVADNYESIGEDALQTPEQAIKIYQSIKDELKAVCVFGENEEVVWSSNGSCPELEKAVTGNLFDGEQTMTIDMVIEEGNNLFSFNEEGTLVINTDVLSRKVFPNIDFSLAFQDSNEKFVEFNAWYLLPTDVNTVCVLYSLSIYGHDLQLVVLGMVSLFALVGVFSFYYICTLVSVIISQRKMTKIIYTDMVTGGENWLAFIRKSSKKIRRMHSHRKLAVVHLQMKKYRSFCTFFGISKGEELLERIYKLLKKQMKFKEVLAHHEKADFALLLSYANQTELISRLKSMIELLEKEFPEIRLKFALGVCYVENCRDDVEELYNNAVLARELHGEEKEPQIGFFNIEMSKQRVWEQRVENDMERALENKEFQVYLQPKFSTGEEKLGGAEALVRWNHPTEGLVQPNRFIPIFERNGFILKLDDFMLDEVARQQAKWISEGWEVVPISVNVSRAHFTREDLAEHICGIVDKYQVPHDVIELELTESAFFDDRQVLLSTVKKLHDAGFSVSMDDFGAGYSSLNSLKELSIDVLKIDADFFRGTDSLDRGMLIVSEVINLAKKLNMKIVAEGIESREQVDFLTGQECDLIQGYYFAKPMPLEEFEKKYKVLK